MLPVFMRFVGILVPNYLGFIWKACPGYGLLGGIKVSDLEALQASGANLRKVVANIVDAFYTQVYVNGFHADPHQAI